MLRAWKQSVKNMPVMSGLRRRPHLKRPLWIIILVTFVIMFLITAYVFPLSSSTACYIFSSGDCSVYHQPPFRSRELSDEEIMSQVVIREILNAPPTQSKNSKIAFLYLTPGTLPFEPLWDKFFHVAWGKISMVDAERRLLAHALLDPDNQQFVLLSDSCVPLHNFDYVYNYLMHTNVSFLDCFVDLGPHGTGRYSEHMMPEIEKAAFRKGSQWFSLKRQHAIIVMADTLYYTNFRLYCKPHFEGRNCYADEHYLPTFFNMIDPSGIANRSVTYVDWSEGKWHPRSFRAQDITFEFLKNLASTDYIIHYTSDPKRRMLVGPCLWNNVKGPCYLFARKFYPETLNRLMINFSNYTAT
ncbi:glycosyltransferase BC10-like isoform X2 [Hibiscus syriacus]|uniref:glycosyltransferase BC10-like isoform X2 n=1 Tax=Hibiscus syriacus TaxID=106335 RepID=UPI0019222014|nr:glycosyltransferase BC10-like isoform X2 [Hibiscus syriacus]